MQCPICHSQTLKPVNLSTGLLAQQCSHCAGHWISGKCYWEWLENTAQSSSSRRPSIRTSIGDSLLPVTDNRTANFCVDCAHLMTKAKVGRGLSFYLDRCSHCHGVWLDRNEWASLESRSLHNQLHYMFSSAWQFRVRREKQIHQKTPA